jgi:hypothetical protein
MAKGTHKTGVLISQVRSDLATIARAIFERDDRYVESAWDEIALKIADLAKGAQEYEAEQLAQELAEAEGVVEVRKAKGGWCHVRQFVRCGKARCHCARGGKHGPYWYGFRKRDGKTVSCYIGKELKADSPGQVDGKTK